MTMFRTAYDTTFGSGVVTKGIENAIQRAFIQDMIYLYSLDVTKDLDYKPVFITGSNESESNIPFFTHPLVVKNSKGVHFLCTDIRPFINANLTTTGSVVAKNKTEFNFIKSRTILNLAWLTGAANQIKINLSFAGTVFAAWLTDVISKRFALDPQDQILLMIVSHYYYQSLFYAEDVFDEDVKQKFAVHTISASKAPSKLVFDVFDQLGPMRSVEDFCTGVKSVVQNIRMEMFNKGLLMSAISNSWFAQNAKEILVVALEHPPTWNAIVFAVLSERSYKKQLIGTIADKYGKNDAAENFLRGYANLLENYVYHDRGENNRGFEHLLSLGT